MRPSLWRPPASCGGSSETQFDVDGQPRSVLLHQSQHHQDVPDIQGEQCIPDKNWNRFDISLIHSLLAGSVQPA